MLLIPNLRCSTCNGQIVVTTDGYGDFKRCLQCCRQYNFKPTDTKQFLAKDGRLRRNTTHND